MNKKLILPFIIVAGVTALYFLGKSRLKNVKVLFRGFKVTGKIFAPKFNLKFGIQNPTTEKANFKSLVGEVSANGRIIANVSSFVPVTIMPNSETMINVIAEPVGISIAKTVMEFIKTKNKLQLQFNGSANIENIVYPLNNELTV